MEKESGLINTFIVIFCEGVVSQNLKNYIRFFPENSIIKKNLEPLVDLKLYKKFHRNLRYFEDVGFLDLMDQLLSIDYALLIQQDPTLSRKNRYCLTHFHVKIDLPIADAAEDLAKSLGYIQANLYENSDKEGRILQNKLFEYYCCHHTVGGRRTAGLIAAQLLKKLDCISTIYVSSSESRALYKYSEKGVSKFILVQMNKKEISVLAQRESMRVESFRSAYLYPGLSADVGVLEAAYEHTKYSLPPADSKHRRLRPAYNWLKLKEELLHPNVSSLDMKPLSYNWVYSTAEG
jgi:hypothetical protein